MIIQDVVEAAKAVWNFNTRAAVNKFATLVADALLDIDRRVEVLEARIERMEIERETMQCVNKLPEIEYREFSKGPHDV